MVGLTNETSSLREAAEAIMLASQTSPDNLRVELEALGEQLEAYNSYLTNPVDQLEVENMSLVFKINGDAARQSVPNV